MMGLPLVSILITSYNRATYIAAAIESALATTYTHFEIVIVDDASTDGTAAIAAGFAQKDARIRLYINEQNLGQFLNRNKAIQLAKGDYIKFLDSDDMLYPHCITAMVQVMQQYPQAGIAVPIGSLQTAASLNSHDSVHLHYNGGNHLCYGPTATLFTKVALDKVGGFESAYGILADTVLNIKIASLYDTVFVPNDLFYWRVHQDQITTEQQDDIRMIQERHFITQSMLALDYLPLHKNEKKLIAYNFTKIHTLHFLKYFFKARFSDAFTIQKATGLKFRTILKAVFK